MDNPILIFFKRTYKVLIVLLAAVIFFLGYNAYLVDHSLANLIVALESVNNIKTLSDTRDIASMLEYPLLVEVASYQVQAVNIANIELAKDILDKPQDLSQMEAVKFAISEIIIKKEKERSPILTAMDRINNLVVGTLFTKVSKVRLEDQVRYLKGKISLSKDKKDLQDAYYELANIYTQLSEFSRAKETYLKAIEMRPETALAQKARFNIAWNEKYQGRFEEAIQEFEKIYEVVPEGALAVFSKYEVAEAYRRKGDYEKAVEIYQQVAVKSTDKGLVQVSSLQAANTTIYGLNESAKAAEMLTQSKALFKGTSIAEYIESKAIPAIVLKYRKQGFRLLADGRDSSNPEKYKEAQGYFDLALEINPQDGESYIGKAIGFLWLNDPDRALTFARKAVQLLPNSEITSVNLGYIYIELNIVDEAIIEFKRFLNVDPFSAYGYYNLGYAYAVKGSFDEAASAFRQAVNIDPNFVAAMNNEGWCLWQVRKYAEAIEIFKKALKVEYRFVDARFNLGSVYRILGRYKEARDEFRTVVNLDPDNYEARDQLNELEKVVRENE